MGEPLMGMTPPELISFVERLYAIAFEDGRKDEREDCAKICDKYTEFSGSPSNFAENCAKAIRARGDTK